MQLSLLVMPKDNIESAPFLRSLLKRTVKLYATKSGNVRKKLNAKDQYQRDILDTCLRINATMQTLRLSKRFLEERQQCPPINDFEISNSEFIRYHLECYYIRITTLKDLFLKLTNRVFRFGIKENIGLEGNLKKRAKQYDLVGIERLFEGLSILMKHIEPIRHNLAHGGYHDDIDLIMIETQDRRMNDASSLIDDEAYKAILKRLLTRHIMEMELIELMLSQFILLTYKNFYPVRKRVEKTLAGTRDHYEED